MASLKHGAWGLVLNACEHGLGLSLGLSGACVEVVVLRLGLFGGGA